MVMSPDFHDLHSAPGELVDEVGVVTHRACSTHLTASNSWEADGQ
jgi:hypothetical protein